MQECNVPIQLFYAIFTLWVKQGKYKSLNNMKSVENNSYFQKNISSMLYELRVRHT